MFLYYNSYYIAILVIAVAIGSSVLLYRNFKPYYKWTLPSLPIEESETDIWRKVLKKTTFVIAKNQYAMIIQTI